MANTVDDVLVNRSGGELVPNGPDDVLVDRSGGELMAKAAVAA